MGVGVGDERQVRKKEKKKERKKAKRDEVTRKVRLSAGCAKLDERSYHCKT